MIGHSLSPSFVVLKGGGERSAPREGVAHCGTGTEPLEAVGFLARNLHEESA